VCLVLLLQGQQQQQHVQQQHPLYPVRLEQSGHAWVLLLDLKHQTQHQLVLLLLLALSAAVRALAWAAPHWLQPFAQLLQHQLLLLTPLLLLQLALPGQLAASLLAPA
jgi:hypothetical protein